MLSFIMMGKGINIDRNKINISGVFCAHFGSTCTKTFQELFDEKSTTEKWLTFAVYRVYLKPLVKKENIRMQREKGSGNPQTQRDMLKMRKLKNMDEPCRDSL